MSLSREHSSILNNHFSLMAQNYNITSGEISSGFNPHGEVIPKFFHSGMKLISNNEDHPFSDINIVLVEDRQGTAFLWAGGEPCTGRTNMDDGDRQTSSLISNPSIYETAETQCDVHIPYGIISKWAIASRNKQYSSKEKTNFGNKYVSFVQKRVCMDVLNIGFNGTNAAPTTSPQARLVDVNKGWIQTVKEQKPEQVIVAPLTLGGDAADPANYVNLDAAVADILDQSIDISLRDGLVCIISDNLIADERYRFYQANDFIKEKKDTSDTFSHFGGLDAVRVPNFPDNTIVVTSLENLSVYIKESTTYRQIERNPRRNRVEDYQHREEAYVVENMAQFAAVTNLTPASEAAPAS